MFLSTKHMCWLLLVIILGLLLCGHIKREGFAPKCRMDCADCCYKLGGVCGIGSVFTNCGPDPRTGSRCCEADTVNSK